MRLRSSISNVGNIKKGTLNKKMKNTSRGNICSAMIGICIGLPWAMYAQTQVHKPTEIVKETEYVMIPVRVSEQQVMDVYELTDIEAEILFDELELLALLVEAEAEDQDMIGKRLVVDVVLNRVDDPVWPDSITEVIYQSGQFTSVQNGRMGRITEISEETYEAVYKELGERLDYEIYFFTADKYGKYGAPTYQHGDHYFCGK